jgi:hypothetical protein
MKRNDMTSNGASLNACTLSCRAAIARTLLRLALAASLVGAASAEVVFEQSPVTKNDAFASISAEQSADGFRLSATTVVTGLTWWGSYSQDPTTLAADAFSVRIFADDGSGAPEATPRETISQQPIRSSTALSDQSGSPIYQFDLVLTPLTLLGAKNWYLSVVNQFDVGNPEAGWYWLLSNPTGENFYRTVDGDPWSSDLTGNLAFAVNGNPGTPIPLPGSLVLMLTGLAGLNLRLPGRSSATAVPRAA